MPELAQRHSLLEELDARQDEVLDQLDELNTRLEGLLHELLGQRSTGAQVA